ncbi:GGDEF domain-containing protein [Cellulomonas triticagri]|uniref:GGDEF domain-containing protein n=1 Tax=Cellulomonas triticagri TaxID=2483352 RepID=A0A3M2J3R0_9CELL|nr:GGDEF domain-containing protein [Cellulomonas triticagri]RMI08717.1 GGDEF domain-containing protein [Cellulomonas triticagri]
MGGMQEGPGGDRDVATRDHLAIGLLVMAVVTTLGGVWPADPQSPVQWWLVVSAVDLVLCGLLLTLPPHQRSTQAVVIAGVVVSAALVSTCHTAQGVLVFALGFVVAGQFAAYALERRRAAVVAGVVVAAIALSATFAPASVHPVIVLVACVLALLSCWLMASQSDQLRQQARTDHLTGALNRGAFYDRAVDLVPRALRTGTPLSAVAFDIDDFKVVNDRHGHLGADDLMAALTAAWRAELPPGAVLGRVGGDEFLVLLPGVLEVDARRWAALASSWGVLSSSAGVATLRPDDSVRSLLDRADADLFAAKDARRTYAGNL